MSCSDTASIPLTAQEILRAIGAWIDLRGYREFRIQGGAERMTIEGVPGAAAGAGEREQLTLEGEGLQRFCEAARLNRSPAPTVSPPSLWPHLTVVSLDERAAEARGSE
jgi:hypothetical protein